MIVVFGATADIGKRLVLRLRERGTVVRAVSRGQADCTADLSTGLGVGEAMSDASVIVSCAHARFTGCILKFSPATVGKLVLTGSAWRYSKITNVRADEVRDAERAFVASKRDGVMLHPTMIYGGRQENNILRLLPMIRRLPIIPAPGGGKQTVQPIYIDDVVKCLIAAVDREWSGPNVVPICGPPLLWKEMVKLCAESIGRRRRVISAPAGPVILALKFLKQMGINRFDPGMVERFKEDVSISLSAMHDELGIVPLDFKAGVYSAVENWNLVLK